MSAPIRAMHEELTRLRRDIHAHPELAFEERRTADLVARELAAAGIEVHRGLAGTGVVGVLRAGEGARSIGLRADMDALPLTERNAFAHRSLHDGVMHACGHDGHTTMLLGAARHLARVAGFDGTVYFIFQPAEEGKGGARAMIEEGLFDRFPMEAVFGMHNWPGQEPGRFGVLSGAVMASADEFDIVIAGRGAHAAMPHQGTDAIAAGAALVQALQSIVARNIDPMDSAVLSITQFHAGDAYNVLPERALLCGTARAFSPLVRDALESSLRRVCDGIAAAFGLRIELEYRSGYPPTINHALQTEVCRAVATEVVGAQNVLTDLPPTMGAEDFAFMLQEKPGCYVFIGNGMGEGGCGLHNPNYDFNDDIIPVGIAYWTKLVQRLLPAERDNGAEAHEAASRG
jgi:hippurate hydrolase